MKLFINRVVVLLLLTVVFVTTVSAQSRIYHSDRPDITLEEMNKTIIKETIDIDERYTIKCEYRPYFDEMIMTVSASNTVWNDDDVEFVIYCAIMHFIEDMSHRYYSYKTVSRKVTYRNVNTVTLKYNLYY